VCTSHFCGLHLAVFEAAEVNPVQETSQVS